MMKVNFKAIGIDDLLGDPGNRNTGTGCRHLDNIPVWASLQITNVAIVRQDLRPQLQVRGRFENCSLWGVHDNGIDLAHSSGANSKMPTRTDYRCRVASMEQKKFVENHFSERRNIARRVKDRIRADEMCRSGDCRAPRGKAGREP